MSEKILRIGLPKGSLQEATIEIFRKAGFPITVDERQYKPDFGDDELWGVLLRAQEMPNYVASGILDCGLTGLDWIRERGVEDEVVEVVDLVYAKRGMRPYKWVLAVHESSDIQGPEDLAGKRIATELPASASPPSWWMLLQSIWPSMAWRRKSSSRGALPRPNARTWWMPLLRAPRPAARWRPII